MVYNALSRGLREDGLSLEGCFEKAVGGATVSCVLNVRALSTCVQAGDCSSRLS
jgi:hypothetical protein